MTHLFQSEYLKADLVGPVLCVTMMCKSVSNREAETVFEQINSLLDGSCPAAGLVMDLGSVGTMTSAGIGTLVRLHKLMVQRQSRLAVCALNRELSELFHLTRMDRLFLMTSDRDTALRELAA